MHSDSTTLTTDFTREGKEGKSPKLRVCNNKPKFRLLENAHKGDLVQMVPNNTERAVRKLTSYPHIDFNKQANSTLGISRGISTAMDLDGNTYVLGVYTNNVIFDGLVISSPSGGLFLTKMDSHGQWIWAIPLADIVSGSDYNPCAELSVDAEGNVYIIYTLLGVLTHPIAPLVPVTAITPVMNTVVARVSSVGVIGYITNILGSQTTNPSISNDESGNAYVTGAFTNIIIFGNITLTDGINNNIYIARINATGSWNWAKKATLVNPPLLGATQRITGESIASTAEGNLYVGGYYNGHIMFDDQTLYYSNSNEITYGFIVKLDSSGATLWVKSLTTQNKVIVTNLYLDMNLINEENVYITGAFIHQVKCDLVSITNDAAMSLFVLKLDSDGLCLWLKGYPVSPRTTFFFRPVIVTDAAGYSYVRSPYEGTIHVDRFTLTAPTEANMTVAIIKYDPHGRVQWVLNLHGLIENRCPDLSVDKVSGRLALTVNTSSQLIIDNVNIHVQTQQLNVLILTNRLPNLIGILAEDGHKGCSVRVDFTGISRALCGLTYGQDYYVTANGLFTSNNYTNTKYLGTAMDTESLLLRC